MYDINLPAGRYRARALEADVYPTKNGEGLMLGVRWAITEGEHAGTDIRGNICLIDGSGNLTKNYDTTRSWAKSWDGMDTAYFRGHFTEWDVVITVERKDVTIDGEVRNVPEVKWVDDPARSSGGIKAADHKAIGTKFGAKLRAAAAAWNRENPDAASAAKKPTATKAAPKAEKSETEPLYKTAWYKFAAANSALPLDEQKQKWFDLVARFTDSKDYRTLPAEIWEEVIADLDDDMPF